MLAIIVCVCGEDILTCPECGHNSCRDHKCAASGLTPCPHQLDERARDDAAEHAAD